ncbi:hypothetical protein IIB34_00020 [PVC group bacterium]|nr:hypothetical protein [PVC group bacterium]
MTKKSVVLWILLCLGTGYLIFVPMGDASETELEIHQIISDQVDPTVLAASNVKRTIWRRKESQTGTPDFRTRTPAQLGTSPFPTMAPTRAPEISVQVSDDLQGEHTKISLEIKGMDILDVLKLLAKKSGLNIVAGRNVRGNVTIFLKDVEIWDALLIILETYDLAYERKNNMIKVMTDADYQRLHGMPFHDIRQVEFVTLLYAKAPEVSQALNLIKTKIGKIIIDDRTNMLVLIDAPDGIEAMLTVVDEIDVPVTTRVYELIYTDVLKIEEKIRDMLSPAGKITMDISTNKLIVTDSAMHVSRMDQLVKEYDSPTKLITRIYPLNYADFSEVEGKISELLTKDIGRIMSDERTSTIAVTDLKDNIVRIDELIEALDQREKQVLIDAKIVQVELNDEFEMGINWEALFENELGGLDLKNLFTRSLTTGFSLGFGIIDSAGVFGAIEVLKTIGKTHILASPRIMTINNKTASIHVGTDEAFITSDVTQSNNVTTITPNVEFQQVGIKLSVTPRINNEDYIIMEIKPEVSSVSRVVELFNSDGQKISEVPIVKVSETETTVMVKSGRTVVIGGLIDDSLSKNQNSIPVLGAIPVLGMFFRNRSNTLKKSELIVFITPTIIRDEDELEAFVESEHARMLRLKELLARINEYKTLKEKTISELME